MRFEFPALEQRRSIRHGMRESLAFALALHLCVALVFVKLGPLPSAPAGPEGSPTEILVVDDHPIAPTDLTAAHRASESNAANTAAKPRKRTLQMIQSVYARQQSSPENSAVAASYSQVANAMDGNEALSPRVPTDGEFGGSSSATGPVTFAGVGKSTSPALAVGHQVAGMDSWRPGSRQWEALRLAIQRRVDYPNTARRMGWQGQVIVTFFLHSDGQVRDVRVVSGSGHACLDSSALQAIERAAPLPPSDESVRIDMPVVFELR